MDDGSDARWMVGDMLERYVDAAFPRRAWGKLVCMRTHLPPIVIGAIMFFRIDRRFGCGLYARVMAQDENTFMGQRMPSYHPIRVRHNHSLVLSQVHVLRVPVRKGNAECFDGMPLWFQC